MSNFAQIDKVIQANLDKFKKPNALTVRPGYKISKGWISQQPAIVVTVEKKTANISPADAIPPQVGGIPTDVREATTIAKLRHNAPERHAALTAMMINRISKTTQRRDTKMRAPCSATAQAFGTTWRSLPGGHFHLATPVTTSRRA